MTVLWTYFWPVVAVGLLLGAVLGSAALRRRRMSLIAIGVALAVAAAGVWHGPLGAADRFAANIDRTARAVLVDWEMGQVQARLARGPLTRRLMLSGPADDFQRGELVRIMSTIPGVTSATWSSSRGLALIVEAGLASLAGFLVGLLLAYLVELHRRYNAQWKW
jgi:hypothetical protein